ncbi:MAG: NYN domain-containing protein [Candidatus Staskawiczbacteria bacterium]|nr:NYN domain-containing protein [Candidatus Staskawiczbacteria bacterium]
MILKENNFAYIDGANLYNGTEELDWKLDYKKFRKWLKDKYNIINAYFFIGYISKNKNLYTHLQESGFILVYKEITYDGVGKVKGNCDALLVLKAVCDFYEKNYEKAVIISSDGDYAELVGFLKQNNALKIVISPNNKCSYLLRKQNIPLSYLSNQKNKLRITAVKEKTPDEDRTS